MFLQPTFVNFSHCGILCVHVVSLFVQVYQFPKSKTNSFHTVYFIHTIFTRPGFSVDVVACSASLWTPDSLPVPYTTLSLPQDDWSLTYFTRLSRLSSRYRRPASQTMLSAFTYEILYYQHLKCKINNYLFL